MSNARGPQRSEDRSVTDADREALRMNAYYYGFTPTGEYAVDKILSAVAHAGKAFHSTEEWSDTDCYKLPDFGGSGCPQEWIQFAAQECAQAIARARADADEAGYSRGLREGAASEREAFARECEAVCPPAGLYTPGELSAYEAAVQDCAAAIRARGERFPLSGADAPSEGGKA